MICGGLTYVQASVVTLNVFTCTYLQKLNTETVRGMLEVFANMVSLC